MIFVAGGTWTLSRTAGAEQFESAKVQSVGGDVHDQQSVGKAIVRNRKTVIFGGGSNPINFVSATDVAWLVELAVHDASVGGEAFDFGAPRI